MALEVPDGGDRSIGGAVGEFLARWSEYRLLFNGCLSEFPAITDRAVESIVTAADQTICQMGQEFEQAAAASLAGS